MANSRLASGATRTSDSSSASFRDALTFSAESRTCKRAGGGRQNVNAAVRSAGEHCRGIGIERNRPEQPESCQIDQSHTLVACGCDQSIACVSGTFLGTAGTRKECSPERNPFAAG